MKGKKRKNENFDSIYVKKKNENEKEKETIIDPIIECFKATNLDLFDEDYRKFKYDTNVILLSALVVISRHLIQPSTTLYYTNDVYYKGCWKDVPYVPLIQQIWYGVKMESKVLKVFKKSSYREENPLPFVVHNLTAENTIETTNEICTQYFCKLIDFKAGLTSPQTYIDFQQKLINYMNNSWPEILTFTNGKISNINTHRIYLYTHIIFCLSDYGIQRLQNNLFDTSILIKWLKKFDTTTKIKNNAEIVFELIACIYIFDEVSDETNDIVQNFYIRIILGLFDMRSTDIVGKEGRSFYFKHVGGVEDLFYEDFHHQATAGIMFALLDRRASGL
jgi:hypothetical protein